MLWQLLRELIKNVVTLSEINRTGAFEDLLGCKYVIAGANERNASQPTNLTLFSLLCERG